MKKILPSLVLVLVFLLSANIVSAHAVVKPAQVGIGAFQVFTLGVPSEKPIATVSVRLVLPDGLNLVTPNVKAGWKVEVKNQSTGKQIKDDDGMMMDEQKPTEIDWTLGNIPAGQRDEFSFQAQVPATATTLNWKVYQTYSDGSVISWDKDADTQPKDASGKADFSKFGPYTKTEVVDDLSTAQAKTPTQQDSKLPSAIPTSDKLSIVIGVLALVLATWALIEKRV